MKKKDKKSFDSLGEKELNRIAGGASGWDIDMRREADKIQKTGSLLSIEEVKKLPVGKLSIYLGAKKHLGIPITSEEQEQQSYWDEVGRRQQSER